MPAHNEHGARGAEKGGTMEKNATCADGCERDGRKLPAVVTYPCGHAWCAACRDENPSGCAICESVARDGCAGTVPDFD